jgi:hypothetical protein
MALAHLKKWFHLVSQSQSRFWRSQSPAKGTLTPPCYHVADWNFFLNILIVIYIYIYIKVYIIILLYSIHINIIIYVVKTKYV